MKPFGHLAFAALSDVGRKRKNNEDAFGTFPDQGVFVVADGMGGGEDGEVASAATVKAVSDWCAAHSDAAAGVLSVEQAMDGVAKSVGAASKWIYGRTKRKNLGSCGSTFVAAFFDPADARRACAMHAGDSRLYLVHDGNIRQITRDHSFAEAVGEKDEGKINPMFRGMILRAVGVQPQVEFERTPFDVAAGDVVVICSDGLSKMVPDKRIAELCRARTSPAEIAESLVANANAAGGVDNVTAVVIRVGAVGGEDDGRTIAMMQPAVSGGVRRKRPRWLIPSLVVAALTAFALVVAFAFVRKAERTAAADRERDAAFAASAVQNVSAENSRRQRERSEVAEDETRREGERKAAEAEAARELREKDEAEKARRQVEIGERNRSEAKRRPSVERGRLERAAEKEMDRRFE